MKYEDKSFNVTVGGDAYAEGWDRIFGKKVQAPAPPLCDFCQVTHETCGSDYVDPTCPCRRLSPWKAEDHGPAKCEGPGACGDCS